MIDPQDTVPRRTAGPEVATASLIENVRNERKPI